MDTPSVANVDRAAETARAGKRRVVGVLGSGERSSHTGAGENSMGSRWLFAAAAISLAVAALMTGAVLARTDGFASGATAMPGVAGVALVGLAVQGGDDAIETLRQRIERFRAGEDVTFDTDEDGEIGALYESVGGLADDVRASRAQSDESEDDVRRVHERITEGFFAVDDDWTYTDVNPAGAEMVGASPADIVGKQVWDVFPHLRESEFEAALRRAMERRETASVEAFYPSHESWYSVTVYPEADGISIYFEDVTERTERERQLAALVENTPSPIYIKDREGHYLFVNQAAADLFDIDAEEMVGKHDSDLFDPGSLEGVRAGDEAVIETESVVTREMETTIDGVHHVFLDNKYPYRDADGTIVGVMGISQDITEQKERERQLSTLIDNVPGMVYRCANEPDWPMEFVSEGAEDLTGYTATELESGAVSWGEDVIVDGNDDVWKTVQRAVEDCEPFEVTYRIETADGEQRWLWEQGQGVFDDEGSLEALEGVIMDVTHRKEHERQLREHERELEQQRAFTDDILDAIDDVFYLLDENGTLQRWNRSLTDVTAYSDTDIEAMSGPEFFAQADRPAVIEAIKNVLDTGSTRVEAPLHTNDGESIPYEFVADRVEDPDGNPMVAGIGRDITDQKERERELRATNEQLNAIIEASPDAIVALDREGHVELWNPAAERIFGWSEDAVLGEPNPIVQDSMTEEFERLRDRVLGGKSLSGVEIRREAEDGTLLDLSLSAAPLRDERGEVVGIMATFEDITERKERQRELERTEELLQQAGRIANVGGWELDFTQSPPDLTWTEEMYNLHGISPDTDVDVETVIDYYHPDDRERIGDLLERAITQGESYDMEVRLRTETAEPTWVRAMGEPVFEDGDVVGVRGSVQDITDRKERERHLESLRETARQFLATESADAAARRVVETAADLLGGAEAAIFLLDVGSNRLEPTARTDGFGGRDALVSAISAGESALWQSYISGEGTTVDGAALPVESPPGDGLVVPVGEHGLLLVTPASSLAAGQRRLIETLATTAETALDRIRTERNLRERDSELAAQNRRLRRQIQINDIIRRIDQSLVRASNREDIERAVCDGLVETDDVAFAWVGELDAAEATVVPRTWAGGGEEYLDTVGFSTTGHALEPAANAARRQAPTVVENVLDDLAGQPWREQALASDFHSVVSVPLAYEDYFYGVLTVYADEPGVFGDLEESVFAELGENIAHSINAAETQQALYADTLVELTLELDASETPLGRGAAALDNPGTFEGLATYDDEQTRLFFTSNGADADAVATVLEDLAAVREYRHVDDTEDGPLFEVTITGSSLPARLVRHGARPKSIRTTPTTMRAVVEVPPATDVREFIGMLAEAHPSVELKGRRTVQRSSQTHGELVTSLFEGLTDRQLEVLRTAFFAGYFEWPRRSTGEDVAEMLDVSQPTVNRHLRLGQQRLLSQLFEPVDDDAAEAS